MSPTDPAQPLLQVQALLTLARELLQADEPSRVLRLTGRALVDVTGARRALLVLTGDAPLCIGFSADGLARTAPRSHPWFPLARGALQGQRPSGPESVVLIAAVPATRPLAALVAGWPAATAPAAVQTQRLALDAILELTAATLGRIGVRDALEQLVTTQYEQIAGTAQEHADELARRDAAAREMLALSLTDVLTGLNNRRGFFARAEPLFRLAQRQHTGSAVVYADIDGLKPVNDALGHAVGDGMIRDAASVLRASLREADVLARLGGDEFVAYAVDEAQPHAILARLQANLKAFNLMQERPYELSFSVGLVSCDPAGHSALSESVQQADRAMYEHKRRRLH